MKLVIFDLDQTIVNIFRVHDSAFHRTMMDVFGLKACYRQMDYTGKRIQDLIREFALKKGVPNAVIDMNIDEAVRVYELCFAALVKNVKKHLLPGVKKLVEKLSKKHKLAIVTGDLKPIAEIVLKESGLMNYFSVIVTADDAPTREKMIKKAIKKSGKVSEVWVIGDSTRDIDAGKANGAKTIGVMTGEHDRKTLMAHKPTKVFKDLSNTAKVLEVIG
ncbi:MAG: HAD family hydrolase [Candidatus Woesearchaeota archaeon]